jgi:hypothetical protein
MVMLEADAFLKEKVFGPVAQRVMDRAYSLLRLERYPNSGIEGWLKVEAARALGDLVLRFCNKGPDLELADNLFVELKTTYCESSSIGQALSYILGALTRYGSDPRYPRFACLFLANGSKIPAFMERLKLGSRVVACENFSIGTHDWIVGLIVAS